jgi:predicted unusual protein kinase regulating ubiquinone biosynthesis (AarF/ABC1/UbiB family)
MDIDNFTGACSFVLRAFTTLEGIGKTLDPNYAFAAVATPYARELLDLQVTPQNGALVVQQVRDQALQLTQNTAAAPGRVKYLENTLRRCASHQPHL